mgnify:CR=1 FL=1
MAPYATALLVLALLLAIASFTNTRKTSGLQDIWRAFAQSRGGVYEHTGDGLDLVRLTLDGVALVLKSVDVPGFEGERTLLTTVTARAATSHPATITARPEGAVAKLAKHLGAQDVVFDDAAFDARFVIKAERDLGVAGVDERAGAEIARSLLHDEVRRGLVGFPRAVTWTYRAGEVTLSWERHERDPEVLAAACAVVAASCRDCAAPPSPAPGA